MIHSMTGFGRATTKSKFGNVTVEIRTLNHKFFEPSIKLPNGLSGFEDRAKRILQASIKRGKIYLSAGFEDEVKGIDRISIDMNVAKAYKRRLTSLKKVLGIKGDIKLEQFVSLPGVIAYETPKVDAGKTWSYVRKTINDALKGVVKDRKAEGRALYSDLIKRIKEINLLLQKVDERSAISVSNYKKHLTRRIKEITGSQPIDKGRVEQEVAIFAKNCDVSEEIVRMKAHLSAFKEALIKDHEVGKKLDFIAQELYREINTVGAKGNDAKISKYVIQIKSEVEKIREQVKNIQ